MQRSAWSGGKAQSDAEQGMERPQAPFTPPKGRNGFGRGMRLAWQQGRFSGRALSLSVTLAGIMLITWGLATQFGVHIRSHTVQLGASRQQVDAFHAQLATLVARAEADRKQALADLQPLFAHWKGLKAEAEVAEGRLREIGADLRNLDELHMMRMQSNPDATMKKSWEDEYLASKRRVDEESDKLSKKVREEVDSRHEVEGLRRQVGAMGAAIEEWGAQRESHAVVEVRGSKQPGNTYDRDLLLEEFLEGGSKTAARREQGEVVGEGEEGLADATEKLALASSTGQTVHESRDGSKALEGGREASSGGEEVQSAESKEVGGEGAAKSNTTGVGALVAGQEQKAQVEGSSVHPAAGMSRSMLPQRAARVEGERRAWLSGKWADKWDGIVKPGGEDGSLRCEMSAICEGAAACQQGGEDNLGCIVDSSKRQEAVQEAARWSWEAYKAHAFGQDELMPLSQTYGTWFDLGLTLVDALDTLLLLGLDSEYESARAWVATELKVDPDTRVNLFETTIRVLGGLLAAFHLSNGDKVMLYKAASLALRLLPAFNSESGIPYSDVNLRTHAAEAPQWTSYSSLSEVTSLSLEFSFLARATGEKEPAEKAAETMHKVLGMEGRIQGLAPVFVDTKTARLQGNLITMGARGDSYYEYLLKQWLLSGKKDDAFLQGYKEAMRGLRDHMLMRTDQDGLLFVGELTRGQPVPKMDHLVCFLPGLMALGHHHGVDTASKGEPSDLQVAEDLMRTCYEMYRRTPTGLAPEIAFFRTQEATQNFPTVNNNAGGGDFAVKPNDAHNLLRPETVESLFVLWRVTGKQHFREWSWNIFRAFHRHSIVAEGGYANLDSCLSIPAPKRDKMESFWLAETLKYVFLTLDDSQPQLVSLDEYVFNTEAHPFPIVGSTADTAASHGYEESTYPGLQNFTLDGRIEYWEELARREAAKPAHVVRR